MRRKSEGRGGEEDKEEEGKLVPLAHLWMGFQDADITVQVTGMGVTVCEVGGIQPEVICWNGSVLIIYQTVTTLEWLLGVRL